MMVTVNPSLQPVDNDDSYTLAIVPPNSEMFHRTVLVPGTVPGTWYPNLKPLLCGTCSTGKIRTFSLR